MELQNGAENPMDSAEIIEVNGQMCVVHKVENSDSLPRLSIMYSVDEQVIKKANGIIGGIIHHKATLNIPMTETFKYTGPARKITQDEAVQSEEGRRKNAVSEVGRYIGQASGGNPNGDYTAEATFYCEENNYDIGKAK